jgi:hypothetical protein
VTWEKHSLGGLYHHDTRYPSEWQLTVQGKPRTLLTSQPLDASCQLFYLTNQEAPGLPGEAVTVRRMRTAGSDMAEWISVTSHLQEPVVCWIFDHERFGAVSKMSSSEPARVTVADRASRP